MAFPTVAAGASFEVDHISCDDRVDDPTANVVLSFMQVLLADQIKGYYPMVPVLLNKVGAPKHWVFDYPTFGPVSPSQNVQGRVNLDKAVDTQFLECTISGLKTTS